MVGTRGRVRLLAGLLAVGLLGATACGDTPDDQAATLSDIKPPPPATEAGDEMTPVEPSPAPPTEPPAEPGETAAPDSPPEESGSSPLPQGELDAGAVASLVAVVDAAQSGVVSSREQLYLTLELSFGGQAMGSIGDVPYALSTTVGELTHVQIDPSALAALSAFEDGMAPAGPAGMPPLEIVLDEGTQQAYVKLAPLAALGPGERPPIVDELAAQGRDVANLWGRPGLEGPGDEILGGFGVGTRPAVGQFMGLLKAASDTGSVLEARSLGSTETAGVATQEYEFLIDLAALVGRWPPFLESFLGGPGGGAPPPPELLDSLPSPLPAGFTLHVDGTGLARQAGFDLDLGALLMAVFAGFGDTTGAPEGAEIDFPEIEYRVAMRIETLAVNDPSLTVSLPDPSLVLDVPFL